MSDHHFENNVRQKMDELKYHPSDTVWAGVEARISRKKRRRRAIVWFPVILLLTGSIYLFYITNQTSTKQPVTTSVSPTGEQIITDKILPPSNKKANESVQPESKKEISGNADSKKSSSLTPVDRKNKEDRPVNAAHTNTRKPLKEIAATRKINRRKSDVKRLNDVEKLNLNPQLAINKSSNHSTTKVDSDNKVSVNSNPEGIDTAIAIAVTESIPVQPVTAIDSTRNDGQKLSMVTSDQKNSELPATASVPPIEKPKKNWQWGITLQAGISKITSGGLLDFTEKELMQDLSSNRFSQPLPANAVLPQPSEIRPGAAFTAGVFVKQQVRRKIDVIAGVNYSFLQSRIKVGEHVQSNYVVTNASGTMDLSAYYRADKQQNYNNAYHFIEIPVQVSATIKKHNKAPLSANAGLVLARLIATNALHYDAAGRVYYKDNSLFNKTQVGFTGGLAMGFLQRSANPFSAGPFFHYRVTNLLHEEANAPRHLFSIGVEVKMLLKK